MNTEFPRRDIFAKCLLYEPYNESTGRCSSDWSIVNREAGCNKPLECKKYKDLIKKGEQIKFITHNQNA